MVLFPVDVVEFVDCSLLSNSVRHLQGDNVNLGHIVARLAYFAILFITFGISVQLFTLNTRGISATS